MVDYFYRPQPAIDADGIRVAAEGSGSVYAITDTTFSTPLTVTLASGSTSTVINVSFIGQVEAFTVANHAEVNFKSGDFVSPLVAWSSVIADALASRQAAETAKIAAEVAAGQAAATATRVADLQNWLDVGMTRYNYCPTPSFENGLGAWQVTNGTVTTLSSFPNMAGRQGSHILQATATGGFTSLYPWIDVPVGGAEWFGVRLWMATDSETPAHRARLSIYFYDTVGTLLAQPSSAWVSGATFYAGAFIQHVAQAPVNAVRARVYLTMTSQDGVVPLAAGERLWMDQVIFTRAATESAAAAGFAPYFDGSTPNTNYRANRWLGTPGNSVSAQLDMSQLAASSIPPGGLAGQALVKASAEDFDYAWGESVGGGDETDHGTLAGLGDDDHPQYLTAARGDARYYSRAAVDSLLNTAATRESNADRNRENHYGAQPVSSLATSGTKAANTVLHGDDVWRVPAGGGSGSTTADGITDATALGKELIRAASQAAARTSMGLGFVANIAPADLPLSIKSQEALALKANVTHSHAMSQVTGLDGFMARTVQFVDVITGSEPRPAGAGKVLWVKTPGYAGGAPENMVAGDLQAEAV